MSTNDVLIGVIGGTGLYHLDNLTLIEAVNPSTPWGYPSSPINICTLKSGTKVAFVARHGKHHDISPSTVPSRANIAALKSLGVRAIIAFSSVGSLREEIVPGHVAIPTQIIDRTKGVRPASFFDGTRVVAHAAFGDPFGMKLVQWLEAEVEKALRQQGNGVVLHKDKCIICMEGPQFSTRAESVMYRSWGADLINMSVLPEAKLAREAEISYAMIASATDYDSWRSHSEAVTTTQVIETLKANADIARHIAASVLEDLHLAAVQGDILSEEKGSMKYSIMPSHGERNEEDVKKLAYILPEYFSPNEVAN
ncbi:nucleoside phosphorylase domain-containing protein [Scleroderma yunnanense]